MCILFKKIGMHTRMYELLLFWNYFRLITKVQKLYRVFLCTRHPDSSNVSTLYNHSTMIRTKKLTLVQWDFIQAFTSFPTNVLSLFQDPSLHQIVMSLFSKICDIFLVFSCLPWHWHWVKFISLGCLVFSHDWIEVRHFWQEHLAKVMFPSQRIIPGSQSMIMFYYRQCYPRSLC